MGFQKESWLGKVMTVQGLIPAETMGLTLPHEHLLITHQGPLVDLVDADLAARVQAESVIEALHMKTKQRLGADVQCPDLPPGCLSFSE